MPRLTTIAKEWTRIGLTGFGGPPAHIALLRELVVERYGWMDGEEFSDANGAAGLLPGPASTQMAIFCGYRVGGPAGAIVGGLGFITPAVVLMLALSTLFLGSSPPLVIRGAGAGAGAAVAAVAVHAALGLTRPSFQRVRESRARTARWAGYVTAGTVAAATIGAYLVLVLIGCGFVEFLIQRRPTLPAGGRHAGFGLLLPATISSGGYGALAWSAIKVGALSFGGGFVIVPLMQADAVHTYHWMTDPQFLNAVALGQITPGPVVATIAAVGYAAHGVAGGIVASVVAFLPSFGFILFGGRHFERIRGNRNARAFLDGAAPAAIGAIVGAGILLAATLREGWQLGVLAAAVIFLIGLRRGVVLTLLLAGSAGVIAALAGAALPS